VSRASAELGALLSERLGALLDEVAEAHGDDAWTVARALEDVDVCLACARNAVCLGHVRPVLRDNSLSKQPRKKEQRSFFRAVGLRHPIIEALDRGERYVPNDVSLGCDGIGGILLYGVNAVGKSSAMKAVGLATLMAQAGMFVACASLELAPFTGIFTRIGLRDDLARGHSTFVVEMLELRTILARASRRSLVIGDELCAGTESPSALSIVGAGVLRLAARGAPFVFATHLHELATAVPLLRPVLYVEEETEEGCGDPGAARGSRRPSKGLRVRAMHLSVQMDAATGRLVLDRTLLPGSGPPTYGIEVCRSLDMGDVFIRTADRIRRHLLSVPETLLGPGRKPSRYNASVVVDRCGVCGAPAEETHHIVPQAVAAPHEKNRSHNLAPLCAACHAATHGTSHGTHGTSQLDIKGYVATSEGLVLATSGSRVKAGKRC
jgi:DNA mismatch repair protein MutS